jgi:hypothetical protein
MVRMVSAFSMGKVSTSPTSMLRMVSVVLFVIVSIFIMIKVVIKEPAVSHDMGGSTIYHVKHTN